MASSNKIKAGDAYVNLTVNSRELVTGLDKAQQTMKRFGENMTNAGAKMLAAGAMLALPIGLAMKSYADFDDQMRLTKAVTGSTGAEFQKLTALAEDLGAKTSYTAVQVAQGMAGLGRMGFNSKEIENSIEPMMNLAKATSTELGEAAQIAANNMRVFKIATSESSHVADVMTVTANSSAQTLVDLGEALKMAGPHAKNAGASFEETCTQLGILANLGIRGSLAGTALGKSYKRLADPQVQAYLKQFNIETVDSQGNLKKMDVILKDVAKVMNQLGSADKINFAENIFDARGSLGGGLLTANLDEMEKMGEKIANASGAAVAAAKQMDDGAGGAFRRLTSAVEGFTNIIGKVAYEMLADLIEEFSAVILSLRDWIGENQALVKNIVIFTGILLTVGASLVTLGTILNATAAIVGVLKVAFIALNLTNPLGWAILAVGAIATLITYLTTLNWEVAKSKGLIEKENQAKAEAIKKDLDMVDSLKNLSAKETLTNDERKKAMEIMQALQKKYGDLGLSIDETTGKITGQAKAMEKLNDLMSKDKIKDIDAQIAAEQKKIKKTNSKNSGVWAETKRVVKGLTLGDFLWGEEDMNEDSMQKSHDKINDLLKQRKILNDKNITIEEKSDILTGKGTAKVEVKPDEKKKEEPTKKLSDYNDIEPDKNKSILDDFDRQQRDLDKSRTEKATDKKIESTLESDRSAGLNMLSTMIASLEQDTNAMPQKFKDAYAEAMKDKTISPEERANLSAMQQQYFDNNRLLDKYRDKFEIAQNNIAKTNEKIQSTSSFSLTSLARNLGITPEDRTAVATEETAKETKKQNQILKDIAKNQNQLRYN